MLIDNVGAGQSAPDAFQQHRYLNLQGYVSDLLEISAALNLRDAIFVGHSVGGMVCALAALKAPQRVARLILIGASPRYLDDDGYHGGFSHKDLDSLYSALQSNYTVWADSYAQQAMANPDQPQLAMVFASGLKSIPASQALTVLCSIFQSDHRKDIARLRLPTLLIQATDDIVVPLAVAHFMHEQIPGSQLAVIDASGHLPHVSAPAIVAQVMRDFLHDNPQAAQ